MLIAVLFNLLMSISFADNCSNPRPCLFKKLNIKNIDFESNKKIKVGVLDYEVNLPQFGINHKISGNLSNHGNHVASTILLLNKNVELTVFGIPNYNDNNDFNLVSKEKFILHHYLLNLKKAVESDIDILNISYSGENFEAEEKRLLELASKKGKIIVVSSGNEGMNATNYPSSYKIKNLISVGNDVSLARKNISSNYGKNVDFFTIGTDLWAFCSDIHSCKLSGTSMSAPVFVSAIAYALDLSRDKQEAFSLLKKYTVKNGYSKYGSFNYSQFVENELNFK